MCSPKELLHQVRYINVYNSVVSYKHGLFVLRLSYIYTHSVVGNGRLAQNHVLVLIQTYSCKH